VKLHLTALLVVGACLALCAWQVTRALGGNELSWAYVFEWPFFGGYAVFVWWRLLHQGTLDETIDRRAGAVGAANPDIGIGIGDDPPPAGTGPVDTATVDTVTTPESACTAESGSSAQEDDEEAELAAYNRYLAELHATGRRSRW
jgi:hypothetical protein